MTKIKFLTDENISPKLVFALRQRNFDVKDIKEEKLFGISDAQVLSIALKENRIIITHDKDFVNILKREINVGIILLRFSNQSSKNVVKRLLPLIINTKFQKKIVGNTVVISEDFIYIIKS